MKGLIDNASSQDHQVALLWQAIEKFAGADVHAVLDPLEEFGLKIMRDDADFLGGVLLMTIVIEGALAPAAELSERKWRPLDPAAAEMNKILFGGIVMVRGSLLMGLRPVAPAGDRFDEDRVGLDHLSFGVPGRADLDEAVARFDERGVPHGEIQALPSFGIYILPFRDPDNLQLELTAPM